MSFPLKNVQSKEVNGTYKLQSRSCLTIPTQPVAMTENGQMTIDDGSVNADDAAAALGIATVSDATGSNTAGIPLSKKAIHQRDADENLFLRFLELDPPPPETSTSTPVHMDLRRKSTHKSSSSKESKESIPPIGGTSTNPLGRTPFTITKKLTRTAEKGFGFSIVWTHPPRIEKVEPGLPADRCGILPGDYVIFVDKHNVVTMPEMDILNLIQSQGKILILEIFRRSKATSNGVKLCMPSLTATTTPITTTAFCNSNAINNNDDQLSEFATPKQSTSSLVQRPITACSNVSLETSKKRLHLPQVTFSKEVGHGVVV